MGLVMALGLAVAARADEPAKGAEDLGTACRRECSRVIDRCVANLKGVFGEMREHCTKVVLERCRTEGLENCRKASEGLGCPAGHVDCKTHCCPPDRPSCAANGRECCPAGYSIACGNGLCCPADRPVCADGRCYAADERPGG